MSEAGSRSLGSRLSKLRIKHLAFGEIVSGIENTPLVIFANSDGVCGSLNGYLNRGRKKRAKISTDKNPCVRKYFQIPLPFHPGLVQFCHSNVVFCDCQGNVECYFWVVFSWEGRSIFIGLLSMSSFLTGVTFHDFPRSPTMYSNPAQLRIPLLILSQYSNYTLTIAS